jgi:ribosome-binding protein aMBF1 (putative translation factor)
MGQVKKDAQEKEANFEQKARAEGWVCELCGEILKREELDIERAGMRLCSNCMHSYDKMEAE